MSLRARMEHRLDAKASGLPAAALAALAMSSGLSVVVCVCVGGAELG